MGCQLIIADGSCPQIRQLAKGALNDLVMIGENIDAIAVITAELRRRRNVGAAVKSLHIVAHGRPGAFFLGGQWINAQKLMAEHQALRTWGAKEIALWSCETDQEGSLRPALEELTGASIFASPQRINNSRQTIYSPANQRELDLEAIIDRHALNATSFQLNFTAGSIYVPGAFPRELVEVGTNGSILSRVVLDIDPSNSSPDDTSDFFSDYSFNPVTGDLIALDTDNDKLYFLSHDGRLTTGGTLSVTNIQAIDVAADGTLYAIAQAGAGLTVDIHTIDPATRIVSAPLFSYTPPNVDNGLGAGPEPVEFSDISFDQNGALRAIATVGQPSGSGGAGRFTHLYLIDIPGQTVTPGPAITTSGSPAAQGHGGAQLAMAVFLHRLRQEIGAMAASLGGVDQIALSGGIGAHDKQLLAELQHSMQWLGPVQWLQIPADEEGMIARWICRET